MQIVFIANTVEELTLDMATVLLIHRAAAAGHGAWVCGVEDLDAGADDRVHALARRAGAGDCDSAWLTALRSADPELVSLEDMGLVWIRTNPARDPVRAATHRASLRLAQMLCERGTPVLNDPSGLLRASSKLYLNYFPEDVRPKTLVSSSPQRLRRFVEETGPSVLKPLEGTHGRNVFKVAADDGNLSTIIDALLQLGPTIAQELVPEADQGDVRVLLLEGKPLTVEGHIAAVRRVPGRNEFRSNIHAGGHPEPVELDARLRKLSARVGARLRQDGIFFAGLDVIGGHIIEINVFSPGGLGDAGSFYGVDFAAAVVEAACQVAGRAS